uniref:Uncharacterized protein n=1 Tax=Cacopsylla melanoneura TaxID=428564 RepID=A0A8D8ZXU1_9HEMI
MKICSDLKPPRAVFSPSQAVCLGTLQNLQQLRLEQPLLVHLVNRLIPLKVEILPSETLLLEVDSEVLLPKPNLPHSLAQTQRRLATHRHLRVLFLEPLPLQARVYLVRLPPTVLHSVGVLVLVNLQCLEARRLPVVGVSVPNQRLDSLVDPFLVANRHLDNREVRYLDLAVAQLVEVCSVEEEREEAQAVLVLQALSDSLPGSVQLHQLLAVLHLAAVLPGLEAHPRLEEVHHLVRQARIRYLAPQIPPRPPSRALVQVLEWQRRQIVS